MAVTIVVLVVALTSRFIQYLGQAVAGELASDVLLLLMLYRLPDFLLVILPLALFLGILLAYGRMYAEHEMVILMGSGFSELRLLVYTLGSVTVIFIFVAILSLVVAPWGVHNSEQLKQSQEQLTEIDLIVAGQFQAFGDGDRVTYAERIESAAETGRRLENVFVAISDRAKGSSDESVSENAAMSVFGEAAGNAWNGPRIILARSAMPEIDAATGARFMRLEDVLQYDGAPGTADFTIAQFDVQSILLPQPTSFDPTLEEAALTTRALLGSPLPEHQAELQWRISMLLLIPIITLIAVPLSKVDPSQGRYSKLLPAALLYVSYFVLLQLCKDMIADGNLSPSYGMWWVHLLYACVGFAVYRFPRIGHYFALGR